ncbi:MAG: hypothetical protein ACXWLH_01955 [Candidatus Saccharimonadales bacterium]
MIATLDLFARGGGGGSGGGSGGGGGGGGIFALYAVAVGHVCHLIMKLPKPLNYVFSWAFAIFVSLASLKLPLGFAFAVSAVIGAYLGISGKLSAVYKYARNYKKVEKLMSQAAAKDTEWNWPELRAAVEKIFLQYQQDWSQFNLAGIQTYTTDSYFKRTQLLLSTLKALGRQNRMSNVKIIDALPASFDDYPDDRQDAVCIVFAAKADDELWEGEEHLYTDKSQFVEEWDFVRNAADNGWLLSNIIQRGTQTVYREIPGLLKFSIDNNFIYSDDFGWLLMPKRGQLFSHASFKNSDINSHVIGLDRKVLVQFYSYIPYKTKSSTTGYIIAQATVPKSYGDIIVRHKSWWRFWEPGKLKRVVPEWGDFNQKYDVFASDVEQVTSLELLNPSFMVKLEALPFKTNIEVVDNNVYFYTSDRSADYQTMLDLLHEAFDEMKL